MDAIDVPVRASHDSPKPDELPISKISELHSTWLALGLTVVMLIRTSFLWYHRRTTDPDKLDTPNSENQSELAKALAETWW